MGPKEDEDFVFVFDGRYGRLLFGCLGTEVKDHLDDRDRLVFASYPQT